MPFPVDPKYIEKAESALGRRLPRAYRNQLIRTNGGAVQLDEDSVWWLYPIFDDSTTKRLRRTCNDILRETEEARAWPDFPSDVLAIAHDGSGNYLVLTPGDDPSSFADAVFMWDHEVGGLERIARSLDDLEWLPG
ncbi:MAG: SMI1/KNR4 family protein [Deltaproteobacteria bacterium]|nr:MAG: SMI1/KNR4 family protein [Deltaproteobacteria bacterium]